MKLSKHLGAILALNLSLAPSVLASATCSQLSGSIYTGSNGNSFDILCDTSTVNGNIFAYYSDGDEFQDCVDRCDAVSICVVALYLAGSGDCALINSYQGTRSFNGNDVAVKRAATTETTSAAESVSSSDAASTSIEISSIEATSTVASTTEPSSTDASSTEVLSTEIEDSSTETSSIEATSTVASTTETSSATEALTTELSSTESFSTEVPSTKVEDSSTDTSSNGAESTGALSTETSSIEAVSTSTEVMSESTSTSEAFTIVTTTTNSHYTSTAGIETSTDDCDDETSTIETSAAEVTSTVTASEILSTTLSTDSLGAPTTTLQTGELSTSAFSETSAFTSSASSLTTTENHNSVSTSLSNSVTDETPSTLSPFSSTTTTEIHATYTQVTFSSWSSLETTKHGSKTRSVSGITTMTTESASRLTTPYPTSDCVWTVYLTMVEYVTCSTGVIPETAITTRYATATNHGESYRPPVVVLPSGCIGGYQVDVSGHSYPVALPTKGPYDNSTYQGYSQPSARPTQGSSGNSHPVYDNNNPHVPAPTVESNGDSRPEYIDGHPSVPESTQGSHAEYDEDTSSQQSTAGYGSPEPSKNRPKKTEGLAPTTSISAYESDVPANLPVSSAIHHGQAGISSTFAIMSTATKDMYRPSASLSTPEEAPSTPLSNEGASIFSSWSRDDAQLDSNDCMTSRRGAYFTK
ncbi:hypothetical protein FPSE_07863 [Fusarium pseudograminearum CS3096]|uniref:Apple domain-containing protein n=1 Tax=Fusarium pseudograminearum (strain CS3096) TaxID=1028729 RepID=K3VDX4_FUSPC|nr:hypothetical protein FPSE_07863 [Fusarium pseudograminearum CS3096]EKJ72009.1 hypothetical protein FPSE_07863 [Fusarium pseudograminearum CS3096]